jgi:hypothetical protein
MSHSSGLHGAFTSGPFPAMPTHLGRLWKGWQLTLILGRTFCLVGFFLLMLHTRYDAMSVLLTTPLGKKMLVHCIGLIVLGTGLELLMFAVLNHWEAARPGSGRGLWLGLAAFGEVALCLFCFLPAIYVVAIGPAAVGIMENLAHVQS